MSSSKNTKGFSSSDIDSVYAALIRELNLDKIKFVGYNDSYKVLEGEIDKISIYCKVNIYQKHPLISVKYHSEIEDNYSLSLTIDIPFDSSLFKYIKQYLDVFKGLIVGELIK